MVTLKLLDYVEVLDRPYFTPYYIYLIMVNGNEVGRLTFRTGSDEEHYFDGHIGYGIEKSYRGHHFAYQACLALKPLIREQGYDHVLLTCDPDNLASKKTIERLGAKLIDQREVPSSMRHVFGKDETVKLIYSWEVGA
ncbi:MAG: GNAT family N-acetyltransferase [Erysipelotrichaceae bacterium]|nr:GNAT family N-acetyltransferase [Erysipelotrichaceae bacterium]